MPHAVVIADAIWPFEKFLDQAEGFFSLNRSSGAMAALPLAIISLFLGLGEIPESRQFFLHVGQTGLAFRDTSFLASKKLGSRT